MGAIGSIIGSCIAPSSSLGGAAPYQWHRKFLGHSDDAAGGPTGHPHCAVRPASQRVWVSVQSSPQHPASTPSGHAETAHSKLGMLPDITDL